MSDGEKETPVTERNTLWPPGDERAKNEAGRVIENGKTDTEHRRSKRGLARGGPRACPKNLCLTESPFCENETLPKPRGRESHKDGPGAETRQKTLSSGSSSSACRKSGNTAKPEARGNQQRPRPPLGAPDLSQGCEHARRRRSEVWRRLASRSEQTGSTRAWITKEEGKEGRKKNKNGKDGRKNARGVNRKPQTHPPPSRSGIQT